MCHRGNGSISGTATLGHSNHCPYSRARDLFAGFLANDMERFRRGEKNIQTLLEKRPAAKSSLLAWKASATLYRAVIAHENNRNDEFQQKYREALDLFAQAQLIGSKDGEASAIAGATYVTFGDRLPKEHRAAAWSQAYDSYQALWKQQAPVVNQLPLHLRGELLGGLAASAMRTGRTEESTQHLDKIIATLSNTAYESVARKWKKDPKAAENTRITCLSCHESGAWQRASKNSTAVSEVTRRHE